jgi:hypothetical protein
MKGTKIANMRRVALTTAASLFASMLPASALIAGTHPGTTGSAQEQARQMDKQHEIAPHGETATYYRWRTANGCVVNLVVVDMASKRWILRTVTNAPLSTVAQTAQHYGASIAINGGFFDTRTGAGVGCIIDRGHIVGNAVHAKSLARKCPSPATMTAIRNRSELRQLVDAAGAQTLAVSAHNEPILAGTKIEESLQAGPALLPLYDPVKEGFIRRNANGRLVDSIDTGALKARTAVGITADGKLLLLTVFNPAKGPDKGGMTLPQVAALLKSWGATEAVNLDGGTSTSMCLRLKDSSGNSRDTTVSGNWPSRRVQSVLLLQPVPSHLDAPTGCNPPPSRL